MVMFNSIKIRNNASIGGSANIEGDVQILGNAILNANAILQNLSVLGSASFNQMINAPGGIKIGDNLYISSQADEIRIYDDQSDFAKFSSTRCEFNNVVKLKGEIYYKNEIFNGKINTGNGVLYDHSSIGTWTSNDQHFTIALDSSTRRDSFNTLKLSCDGQAVAGAKCYDIKANEDWSDRDAIGFWIYSSENMNQIQFYLINESTTYTFYFDATAKRWQYKTIDISNTPRTSISELGFALDATNAAKIFTLNLGKIIYFNLNNSIILAKTPVFQGLLYAHYISKLSTDNHIANTIKESDGYLISYSPNANWMRFIPLVDLSNALIFVGYTYD